MNKEEIRIKCLELAIEYMRHMEYPDNRCSEETLVRIAKTFERYITGKNDEQGEIY